MQGGVVATASFAALLRQHRQALGLTQEELAERAGLSGRAISDLERELADHQRLTEGDAAGRCRCNRSRMRRLAR